MNHKIKSILNQRNSCCCRLPDSNNWAVFSNPEKIIIATQYDEIESAFEAIEQAIESGFYAVGNISYEAAKQFDDAMVTHPPNRDVPLVWFAIYKTPDKTFRSLDYHSKIETETFSPEIQKDVTKEKSPLKKYFKEDL